MAAPGFWDNSERAQTVVETVKVQKRWVDQWAQLHRQQKELAEFLQLAEEEDDEQAAREVEKELGQLEHGLSEIEFQHTLGGVDDRKDAIVNIHSGAGGTESQDWAQMLMRMYLRWAERREYATRVLDLQPGDEAGIKNVTVEVQGEFAYGYLKAEIGVHRLVRISPFDANKRRHTSFASVFVYPEVEDAIEVEVDPSDLRVDTFRASGAGGQHVNKTDSAVRITHLPTGIVVQCQAERSQHRNRENALKVLRARLYQHYLEQEMSEKAEREGQKKKIEWGSQIRSYVLHPYTMVKDHRTDKEIGNAQAVLDGELDDFIQAYLTSH
ncbi:MAG: peptide chain release factor 2 [candidate division Zixibacteria bacterium SM23_81]|nr:MAG: peptide chain release factor 2 [candidate division Zixibacteria bacterium SM23_81]